MKVRVRSISPMGAFRCAGKAWPPSEVIEEVSVEDALKLMACSMLKVEEVAEEPAAPAPVVLEDELAASEPWSPAVLDAIKAIETVEAAPSKKPYKRAK